MAAPAVSAQRLLGRIQRTFSGWRGKGHGFITTDDHQKYFFHQDDVIGQFTPPEGSLVTFNVIKQTAKRAHDRAVNIQVETVPS